MKNISFVFLSYFLIVTGCAQKNDYVVTIKAPLCLKATLAPISVDSLSGVNSNVTNPSDYLTLWEIEATAQNQATGASVVAKQGISKQLTLSEYLLSSC